MISPEARGGRGAVARPIARAAAGEPVVRRDAAHQVAVGLVVQSAPRDATRKALRESL